MKFEIFIGKDRLFHWHLKSVNGQIICWSEGYTSLENTIKSINLVKKFSAGAIVYKV